MGNSNVKYVVITPVRDEEAHIKKTIKSMLAQTLKPLLWVITDDGSKDQTPEIVTRYVREYPFMRLLHTPHAGIRQPGSGVIRTFNHGYASIGEGDYDYIVKLDGDLSFRPDYFEKLLGRFLSDSRLGIASGVYFEEDKAGSWKEVVMPSYHAAGACKVLRRKCFEEIGGFIVSIGWDTVDEIRAMTRGWKTGHFSDLQMQHHKIEGSGIGATKTSLMHGEIYYLMGGCKLFFLLKLINRMITKPYVLSALALLWGYARALLMQKRLLVSKEEALFYQGLLRERLWNQAKTLFGRR
jgi:glycosyltransferase involved in cell wall biosynthesis